MSKGLTVTVEGADELRRALKKLGEAAAGRTAREAMKAGGGVLLGFMQANIVEADLVDTGNLLNNWKVENDGDLAAVVGTTTPYAAIHEFGGTVNAKTGGWLRFQTADGSWHTVKSVTIPARPYIRPAIDEHSKDVSEAVGEVIRDEIKRLVKP